MMTPEIKFCVRYLKEHGISTKDFETISKMLGPNDAIYSLVKVTKKSFFEELAEGLRELWPAGLKDGMYPWRDSVDNLTRRLQTLWAHRFPTVNDGSYTIEQCLTVARRYLAKFESDTKYMRTLKYYILKQQKILLPNGRFKIVDESLLADMLEGKAAEDAFQNEWDDILNSASIEEGEII